MPWMLGLVVAGLFAVAIVDIVQGDRQGPDGDGGEPTLAVRDGSDFDPFSEDGEHPEDVDKAFDDDPDTAWQTQRYNSADLGGLKDGVGMWVDLGEPVAVGRLDIELRPAGADLEVYAADEPPPTGVGDDWAPSQWGERVAEAASATNSESFELEDVRGRYFLLWFTSLPPDAGRYRVHVGDLTFAG